MRIFRVGMGKSKVSDIEIAISDHGFFPSGIFF